MTNELSSTGRRLADHPALEMAARVGYAASGVLHLLIGWIAVQLAWGLGGGGTSADQSGAMSTLAGHGLGKALLWVASLGLVGLGLLNLLQGAFERGQGTGKDALADRGKDVAKGITYLALAVPAFTFASGGSSSSKGQTKDITHSLLTAPGGKVLVVLVGLVVLGIGAYHVHKGWSKKFMQDLVDDPGELAEQAGRAGYIAKGAALGVLGVLFVVGGVKGSSKDTGGLDSALRTLLEQPFGSVLVTLIGLGFAAYAVYSFFRAKHARL